MEIVKSSSVPIAELKKNSKIYLEIFSREDLLKIAKSKNIKLILEDENKLFFTTIEKELYFYFKAAK